MSNVTEAPTTVEQLEAMWASGDPHWLVRIAFADDSDDVPEAADLLRSLLDDPQPKFTLDSRDNGVARLQRMSLTARTGGQEFAWASNALAKCPPDTLLLVGWSAR